MRLGDVCAARLSQLAESRQDLWVLDGDLADSDGAALFAADHPDRFVMGGIAEQSLVSMAAGMASCGARPWVFSFAAFLCFRSYDQIRVGLSQSRQAVTLVGSHAGGCAGRNGKTHSALNDLALMTTLPGMRVWSPGDTQDVVLAVDDVLDHQEPAYLRLPRQVLPVLGGRAAPVRWLTDPAPIALVSTGFATHLALEAQMQLERRGISAGVVHCARLAPFPAAELAELVQGVPVVVTIEDHSVHGGLGSFVRDHVVAPALVLGWPADWTGESGSDHDLLARHRLDAEGISARVVATLESRDLVGAARVDGKR